MRSRYLLPVRSFCSRFYHHAAARPSTVQTRLSGSAVVNSRKSLSATAHVRRLSQEPKTFTRYTLPTSIRIERANDMTTGKLKRTRTAYIALGSNLGDRIAEIERACREMDTRGIRVKRTSSLWETEPMYYAEQDRFVNGTCEVSLVPFLSFFLGVGVEIRSQWSVDLQRSRLRRLWSHLNSWINSRISRTQWGGKS